MTSTKVRGYVAQVTDSKPPDDALSGKKKPKKPRPSFTCLAQGCTEATPFPLCGTHYHALISGKHATVDLINQYGAASYDPATQLVVYPAKVPANRMSSNVRKVTAAAGVVGPQ